MYSKLILATGLVGFALLGSAYAQEQKAPAPAPQANQGMMMPPEMVARMNKMMDQCEKMMGDDHMKGIKKMKGMKKMRHHDRS